MTALRHSIRLQILVFSALANLLLIFCFTVYLHHVEKIALDDKLKVQLYTAAKMLQPSMDEYHSKIENNLSVSSEEYNQTLKKLTKLANSIGVEYIYTLVLQNGQTFYTADSYTEEDLKKGKITRFYMPYPDAPKGVMEAINNSKPTFEEYADSYGEHRSIFFPSSAVDNSSKRYVIGVDISIKHIDEELNSIVLGSAWYTIVAMLVAMLISFIVYNPMLNSIVELSNLAKEVAKGNLSARSKISRKDEIGDLANSINQMIGSLGEFIENIEKKVGDRTENLSAAMNEIVDLHKSVRDSISYASMIQSALIPTFDVLKPYFSDCFSIWQPKDTVGGDIYMFESFADRDACLIFVIDCTGHGVPGAFVTMLVKAIERSVVAHITNHPNQEVSPGYILSIFNKSIKTMLRQDEKNSFSNVGFDGTIFYYNKKEKQIKFASAQNHVMFMQDGKVKWFKGDRQSVGYKTSNPDFVFTEHTLEAKEGDLYFLSTDGLYDQNGGEKDIPFGRKRVETIFTENADEPLNEVKELLLYELGAYQGRNERNDDMAFIGFKI